jgi:hypothetical protein
MIKKSNEYTLKQAIEELMNTYRLQGKINEVKLLNSWEKVMGPAIAKYTRNLRIEGRVLYIELNSAPLREELSYAKSKMVKLLNDEAGGQVIDDIVLR